MSDTKTVKLTKEERHTLGVLRKCHKASVSHAVACEKLKEHARDLVALLVQHGFATSQSALAGELGVSRTYLSRLANNEVEVEVTPAVLDKLMELVADLK